MTIWSHIVELVWKIGHKARIEKRILRILVGRTMFCCYFIFFLVIKLPHIVNVLYWDLEYLVAFSWVIWFDQLSGFNLARTSVIDKVVNVLVFEMQVESWVTKVLLRTEALVSGSIFVFLGLSSSSSLRQIIFFAGRSIHIIMRMLCLYNKESMFD